MRPGSGEETAVSRRNLPGQSRVCPLDSTSFFKREFLHNMFNPPA